MPDLRTDEHRTGLRLTQRVEVGDLSFRILSSPHEISRRPAIVLVHGIGVSHRYFTRLHEQFADTYEVHSVDLPGFGGLPKPRRDVTVAEMARALAAVLVQLGLTESILVGHSMGAQWVVEAAIEHPELASMVVVIGPVSDDRHRTMVAQSVALAVDTIGEPLDGNVMVFSDYIRCGPGWYVRQLRQMLAYPLETRVLALAHPLLIIRGGDDPIAGLDWTRRLRDRAQRGSLVIVPGKRHLVQHTAPRAVSLAIAAFMTERPPRIHT